MVNILKRSNNFIDRLMSLFYREAEIEVPTFDIEIPSNILHRTELICNYIKKEKGYDFEIENFLMLLYLDFVRQSVVNYNPEKVYKELTKEYYRRETMTLSTGDEIIEIERSDIDFVTLEITIEREDVDQGMLILEELYDLYKIRISFNRLLESLWIGFIESYKRGENKRAYASIVKLLKECFQNKEVN